MDREQVIKQIDAEIKIAKILNKDYTTVDLDVLESVLALLKEQEAEIRQLQLALDIAKGTCKGIKVKGR